MQTHILFIIKKADRLAFRINWLLSSDVLYLFIVVHVRR